MDLLDYGSSDEDDGGEQAPQRNAVTTGAAPPPVAKAPPSSILKNKLPAPTNKRGKKILSLQAVLPPHILEQLTQSQVRGDDDEDEEDDGNYKAKTNRNKQFTNHPSKDEGIDSFLSELQKSAPAATKANLQQSSSSTTKPAHPGNTKLGQAFLSTTTVVTSGSDTGIRDIHGDAQQYTLKNPPAPKPSSTLKPAPRPPVSVPRPSKAAPVVASAPPPLTTAAPQEETAPNKKRRRQEMERLLRQGQLDAALDQDGETNSSTIVALSQPQSLGPTDGAATNVDTTGLVRMAPTPMYDARQGQAVVGGNTGAGRGKNQINHLLASAANLELARARGMVAKPGQNSHRANAKRKYGW